MFLRFKYSSFVTNIILSNVEKLLTCGLKASTSISSSDIGTFEVSKCMHILVTKGDQNNTTARLNALFESDWHKNQWKWKKKRANICCEAQKTQQSFRDHNGNTAFQIKFGSEVTNKIAQKVLLKSN